MMNKRSRFFIPLFVCISMGLSAQVSEVGIDPTEIPDSIYPKPSLVLPKVVEIGLSALTILELKTVVSLVM
jgi:hypothetical protein